MEEKILTTNDRLALIAAHRLRTYCNNHDCADCLLYQGDYIACKINSGEGPACWELPELTGQQVTLQDTPATPEVKHDNVNHPGHYTAGGVECIDAIEAATVNLTGIEAVCTDNVIKYSWRWKLKNGVEDLKKAAWYLHKLIKKLDPTWRAE